MQSKVLKIGTVLLACVCLVSLMVFPVSAVSTGADSNYWYIPMPISQPNCTETFTYIEVFYHQTDGSIFGDVYLIAAKGLDDTSAIDENPDLRITVSGNTITFTGAPSSHYTYDIFCVNGVGTLWNIGSTPFGGGSISTTYSSNSVLGICKINYYGFAVSDGNSIINNITEVYMAYSSSSSAVNYLALILATLKNQNNSDITNAINNQTQQQHQDSQAQIEAEKENTEQITSGWEGAESIDDSTANNYKDSESAALGGKSDEDVQNEVNNAMNFDISAFDSIKVGKIHSLFDNVLAVTGSWQSLFVLSLTLGLGAFLIGRRYG